MSKTLAYISDRRSPVGDVGIELEVEGRRFGNGYFGNWPHVRNWVAKTDGSLRNGQEYVTRTPVKVDNKLRGRIDSLVTALGTNVTDNSSRTSCHVHVNALSLTPIELANGCLSFWLAEEILSDYWGEERKGNTYSLRLGDGMQIDRVIDAFNSKKFFGLRARSGEPDPGLQRYSALNLCSFGRHGSVEFRGMRGTVDTDVINNWVKTCHHIMHIASKRYKSPIHLMENYMNTSNTVDFMKKITGPFISDQLDFSEDKLDRVNDNAIKLTELAYMHDEEETSWDKWEAGLVKERSKRTQEAATEAGSAASLRAEAETGSGFFYATGDTISYTTTLHTPSHITATITERPAAPTPEQVRSVYGLNSIRGIFGGTLDGDF